MRFMRCIYIRGLTATAMTKNYSIRECFDDSTSRALVARNRLILSIFSLSLILCLGLTACFATLHGLEIINPEPSLALAVVFAILSVACIFGLIFAGINFTKLLDTISDRAEQIQQEAAYRSDAYRSKLVSKAEGAVHSIMPEGFYFSDISSPFLQRRIDGVDYSSNYQVALIYLTEDSLHYVSSVFSLVDNERRSMNGVVPFRKITAFEIIKANNIDLFRPQLKLAFGERCMLFTIDSAAHRINVETMREVIFAHKDSPTE